MDFGIDSVALPDNGVHDSACQFGRDGVPFRLGDVTLQDCRWGALTEICLEHGRQGETACRPPRPDPIRPVNAAPAITRDLVAHSGCGARRCQCLFSGRRVRRGRRVSNDDVTRSSR